MTMPTVEEVIFEAMLDEQTERAWSVAQTAATALREAGMVREWPLRINRDALADISTEWNFPFAVSDDAAWPELHRQLIAIIEVTPPLPEGTPE